jgi:hypothetical protein
MALAKGTNSYATVSEADSYFEDRLDVAAWTNANATQKAQALVTATRTMDELDWIGIAVSDTQALAFPRVGVYFDPRLGSDLSLDETFVPKRIITATYELAYHLLNNDGLLDDTGSVKNLSIGSISLDVIDAPGKIPLHVKRIIRPLLINGGSNPWWRSN